jgi:hypothetical protein
MEMEMDRSWAIRARYDLEDAKTKLGHLDQTHPGVRMVTRIVQTAQDALTVLEEELMRSDDE